MAQLVLVTDKRKIVYDVVSLSTIEEQEKQAAATIVKGDHHVYLDVLLLHGMAPIGRKCWGFKDHSGNNTSLMKNGKLASENVNTFIETIPPGGSTFNRSDNIQMIRSHM